MIVMGWIKPLPQRCPPPQEPVNMLPYKAKGTLQKSQRVLRWGKSILDYPGGLMWCDDYKREAGGIRVKGNDVMMETEVREMHRVINQESLAACGIWKRQGMDSLLELPKEKHPCWPVWDFWSLKLQNNKSVLFSPSLGGFVTAATEINVMMMVMMIIWKSVPPTHSHQTESNQSEKGMLSNIGERY